MKLFYKIMYKLTMNYPIGLYFEDKLYPIKTGITESSDCNYCKIENSR